MSRSLAAGRAEFAAVAFDFGGQRIVIVHFFASAGRAAAAKSAEARRLAMGEYQAKESV
jgi:hypothetical protein